MLLKTCHSLCLGNFFGHYNDIHHMPFCKDARHLAPLVAEFTLFFYGAQPDSRAIYTFIGIPGDSTVGFHLASSVYLKEQILHY
jgi:hypothetical protein